MLSQLWLGLVGKGLERPLPIGVLLEGGSGSTFSAKKGWLGALQ